MKFSSSGKINYIILNNNYIYTFICLNVVVYVVLAVIRKKAESGCSLPFWEFIETVCYTTPCAIIAFATFRNPATLAPFT